MIYISLAYVFLAVSVFALFLTNYQRKTRARKQNELAMDIMREDYLLAAIQNPYHQHSTAKPSGKRKMVSIDLKRNDKKEMVVYDLSRGVYLSVLPGDRIRIDTQQSIYSVGVVYLGSSGMILERLPSRVPLQIGSGLTSKTPRSGTRTHLEDRTKLRVGSNRLLLEMFTVTI